MENKKFVKLLTIFIIIQPFFDIFIYFVNRVLEINFPLISLIRPAFAIGIYLYLLFNNKVSSKAKKFSFLYLLVYSVYCLVHIINIKDNFFSLSFGGIGTEFRYLSNYGYFILQLINFYLIFKILNEEEKKQILKSFVFAILIMASLYFLSLITNTSTKTYIHSLGKDGFRGWSVSAHYIGHSIAYALPVIIYVLFEKSYINKWYKYLIFALVIIPPFYLVGTKTPLFAVLLIVLFYTFMQIIISIKTKKINKNTIYLIIISCVLIGTFTSTYGFSNFKNQLLISEGDDTGVDLINDNLKDLDELSKYDDNNENRVELKTFEDKILYTLYKYRDIRSSVFDNRIIQKTLNKELDSLNSINDKLFGYGHETMPNCTWVETDVHTIYYCYGLVGFTLVLLIPLGFIAINGIRCLINIKQMTKEKFILGFGFGISLFILYSVGYTMQFSQTVFYLVILLIVSNEVFNKIMPKNKENKDYLFAINDLNIGGAEVGMVDVVNELVNKGQKVDIVLLRKQGPLLDKVDKKVNIYEILNKNYSPLKNKIYYILYMLGGIFTKYVYSKTIKYNYNTEIAYLEGYPAVFISASTNPLSIKIASIRVGLKNHKLKAAKLPWGEFRVKQAYKKIDNIYTVSDLTTKEFLEKYPFCKTKTTTIYTYFNLEDMRKKAQEKIDFSFDKNKINFLAVGRFSEQKSYDRLIEAFGEIVKENKNVLLHFIGNDKTNIGDKIKDLIKNKNLEDKVIIHGVITNPYPYIKKCDVLVSSSLYEGFPRVINEAIGLGKLCIGTNVTGTKEALQNGRLGILVDDSIEGLINGMKKYIDNPNIYLKYKEKLEEFDGNKEIYFKSLEKITHKKKSMIIYMPKLSFGGMEKALVNLINYAKLNEKYQLTLYLIYKGEMNYINLLPKNINLIIASPNKWNMTGKIKASIKIMLRYMYQIFNKYDIAISYSYQHPILTTLTRLSSENNIVYIHSNIGNGTKIEKLKDKLKKCKYEKFKKIICVSYDAKKTLEKLIYRKKDIYVLNNVIDGDQIIRKSKEEVDDFNFEKDKIYLINIARHYEEHKRLIRIINATNKLNKEGYEFEVLFIGDGEDHKLYEDKIKEYNIKNIRLLGKKENPYKYLAHSSALLLSSTREGYPVVFIEAMVLNKPIITTNVSDAKVDIENKFGIVVNNDDNSIYDGMKEFIEKGYKIKNKFDYEKFNKSIEEQIDIIYNKD